METPGKGMQLCHDSVRTAADDDLFYGATKILFFLHCLNKFSISFTGA